MSRAFCPGDRVRFWDDSDAAFEAASTARQADGSWEGSARGVVVAPLDPSTGIDDGWAVDLGHGEERWAWTSTLSLDTAGAGGQP